MEPKINPQLDLVRFVKDESDFKSQGLVNVNLLLDDLKAELEKIPEQKKRLPDPMIYVPALQAATYTAHHPDLRKLFKSLLVSASNLELVNDAHPSFVEIIKQLSPLDARILRTLSQKAIISLAQIVKTTKNGSYTPLSGLIIEDSASTSGGVDFSVVLENLDRLKLIETDMNSQFSHEENYEEIIRLIKISFSDIVPHKYEQYKDLKEDEYKIAYRLGVVKFTEFGRKFVKVCVEET